jgi:hypothetical protein
MTERSNAGKVLDFVVSKERMNESKDDDSSTQNTSVQDSRGSISSLGTTYSRNVPHGRICSENLSTIPDGGVCLVSESHSFQSPADVKVLEI